MRLHGKRALMVGASSPSMTGAGFADEATVAGITREVPVGRLSDVGDMANSAVRVASDECFQTGDVIRVSGGGHLRRLPTPRDFVL